MALSVAMQKDIGEYREKLLFGLTARSLLYLGVACILAAVEAVIAVMVFGLDISDISLLLMVTVLAGFFLAYYRPLGMDALDAIPLLARQLMGTNQLPYRSSLVLKRDELRMQHRKEKFDKMTKKEKSDVRKEKERYANERAGKYARCSEILLPRIYHADAIVDDSERSDGVGTGNHAD